MIQFYSFAHYVQAVVVTVLLIILIACFIAQTLQVNNHLKRESEKEDNNHVGNN